MENILVPTSIVGCSVSLLFSLGTVVVLGCFREWNRSLAIKQQYACSLILINIIMLSGLQGMKDKTGCRSVVCLLHYSIILSFCWLCMDHFYFLTTIKRGRDRHSFLKLAAVVWGIPLIFVVLIPILGLTNDGRMSSTLYKCWDSDHVVWALVIPCFILTLICFYFLMVGSYLIYYSHHSNQKVSEATLYSLKTNFTMLLLKCQMWSCGGLIFWYPTEKYYHIWFGFSQGLEGLFTYFFYCVFCLELDLYVNNDPTNISADGESMYTVNAEDPSALRPAESAEVMVAESSSTRDIVAPSEHRAQVTYSPIIAEKDLSDKPFTGDEEKSPVDVEERVSLQTQKSDTTVQTSADVRIHSAVHNSNTSLNNAVQTANIRTTAMVHSPDIERRLNPLSPRKTSSASSETPSPPHTTPNTIEGEAASSKVESEEAPTSTTVEPQKSSPVVQKKEASTSNLDSELSKKSQSDTKTSPVDSRPSAPSTTPASSPYDFMVTSYPSSSYQTAAYASMLPERTYSNLSMGSTGSRNNGGARKSSKVSNCSYISQMGMNELESLFNNPEMMNQSMSSYNPNRFGPNWMSYSKPSTPTTKSAPTTKEEETTATTSTSTTSTVESPVVDKDSGKEEQPGSGNQSAADSEA